MPLTSIRLYNLRKTVRARISQNDPLHCQVLSPRTGRLCDGRILDVGEGGAGVVAVEGEMDELTNGQRVTLRFTLPDTQRVVRLESAIRHARFEEDRIVFGVEFGVGRSPGFFAIQLGRLRRFVLSLFKKPDPATTPVGGSERNLRRAAEAEPPLEPEHEDRHPEIL